MNLNFYSWCLFIFIAALASCEDYGETWFYFIDDKNGSTHVLNFSLPTESRGFILGDVYFYLYTRQNVENAEELVLPKKGTKITSKYFNQSNDIRAITHGWLSDTQLDWVQGMKNNFLNVSDFNVILVEWGELAKNPIYPWPALCTRYVGKQFSKLLGALADSYEMKERNIHLVGHSLGAQVMGYTGMFSNGRVNRITGLDPARPLFEFPEVGKDFRLDDTDAGFVDIIHSCKGTLGYKYSHGDADFYPNGGSSPQPECESNHPGETESCSHARSYQYFSASIIPEHRFDAYRCEDWDTYRKEQCYPDDETLMGYPASYQSSGDYYLCINNK